MEGYLAHEKPPLSEDHRMALGICLLQGPRGVRFLISEVTLYRGTSLTNLCGGTSLTNLYGGTSLTDQGCA